MAESSIKSSCQNISRYFQDSAKHKFIIPDYQRPYSWDEDQINTLFDDLKNFMDDSQGKEGAQYFLGSVVTFENANGELEIIDGQQRITSLCLLLRCIYEKFHNSNEAAFSRLMNELEGCLWTIDYEKNIVNKDDIIIESRAVSDTKSEYLKKILISGQARQEDKDLYSVNYLRFKNLFDAFCLERADKVNTFINMLLHSVILLPIESTDEDFALRIFSTLNDRGLPLSDADIFKAKCYGFHTDPEEKNEFVKRWKELEDDAEKTKVGLQSLFYYYMFFLRAEEGDHKSTTPGLRKYYSLGDYKALKVDDLLDRLTTILNLWKVVNLRVPLEGESWSTNIEINKMLDILSSYTNDYWKYPVSIYYFKYHTNENFESDFLKFLRMFASKLIKYYVEVPTISHVKSEILKLNEAILSSETPTFEAFKNVVDLKQDIYQQRILTQNNKPFIRMLLKVIAYSNPNQNELLPQYWEIEHIFPQTWDEHIYLPENCGYTKEFLQGVIENLGNKVPFEKVLNIKASNNYFYTKKEAYRESKIQDVLDIMNNNSDWDKNNINTRNVEVVNKIVKELDKWESEYSNFDEQEEVSNPLVLKYKTMLDEGKISQEVFEELIKDIE